MMQSFYCAPSLDNFVLGYVLSPGRSSNDWLLQSSPNHFPFAFPGQSRAANCASQFDPHSHFSWYKRQSQHKSDFFDSFMDAGIHAIPFRSAERDLQTFGSRGGRQAGLERQSKCAPTCDDLAQHFDFLTPGKDVLLLSFPLVISGLCLCVYAYR